MISFLLLPASRLSVGFEIVSTAALGTRLTRTLSILIPPSTRASGALWLPRIYLILTGSIRSSSIRAPPRKLRTTAKRRRVTLSGSASTCSSKTFSWDRRGSPSSTPYSTSSSALVCKVAREKESSSFWPDIHGCWLLIILARSKFYLLFLKSGTELLIKGSKRSKVEKIFQSI